MFDPDVLDWISQDSKNVCLAGGMIAVSDITVNTRLTQREGYRGIESEGYCLTLGDPSRRS